MMKGDLKTPAQRRAELQEFAQGVLRDQPSHVRRAMPFLAVAVPAIAVYQLWSGGKSVMPPSLSSVQVAVSTPSPGNARPDVMTLTPAKPAAPAVTPPAVTPSVVAVAPPPAQKVPAPVIASREAAAPDPALTDALAAARLNEKAGQPETRQPSQPGLDAASIGQQCLVARAQGTQPDARPRSGEFTLDDRALQLRCLMTMQVEQRLCSEEERERVARNYVAYSDMIEARRPRAGAKPDQILRWREIWDSPLHKGVTEDLSDLILRGYIDQSYFGAKQSPAIQALFANVTGIPDPCVKARAESLMQQRSVRPAIVVRPR